MLSGCKINDRKNCQLAPSDALEARVPTNAPQTMRVCRSCAHQSRRGALVAVFFI